MDKHTVTINIDFDDILNYVYAQSAWHCAHNEKQRIITPDNSRMLLLKLKEGYANLRSRAMAIWRATTTTPISTHATSP